MVEFHTILLQSGVFQKTILDKSGTGYFLLFALGLPPGRNLASSPNSRAISSCDSIFPKGLCLFTHWRSK